MIRFAAVGLDHRHIYHHVEDLLAAGAECAGYCPETSDPHVLEGFRKRFPDLKPVERRRLIEDPSIQVICCAAVPRDRAAIAVEAMRHGKDVMVDKPGATTLAELDAVRRAVKETGRIWSICFSERFVVPAMETVSKLVGRRRHRPRRADRRPRPAPAQPRHPPAVVLRRRAPMAAILVDIASHQIDQFLFLTGSTDAEIVSSAVANYAMPDVPSFQDFGEIAAAQRPGLRLHPRRLVHAGRAVRPGAMGACFLLGTEGFIEVRKYVDIAGRPGHRSRVPCPIAQAPSTSTRAKSR